MKKRNIQIVMLAAMLVLSMALWGCECLPTRPSPPPKVEAPPPPPEPVAGCPEVRTTDNSRTWTMAVPTGDRATSHLLLERTAPIEVTLGKSYEYTINVTNLTECPCDTVVVTDKMTAGDFAFESSTPQAEMLPDGTAQWNLGRIPAKGSMLIRVQGAAKGMGDIAHCLSATCVPTLCQTTKVSEPMLKLTKTLPAEVALCEDIPVSIVVSNPGTGRLHGVTITDTLPAGLATTDGKDTATFDVGELKAGESREFTFVAKAQRTGTFDNAASVNSAEGLTANAAASVTVRQAVLTIDKTGSSLVMVGRPADYGIRVGNVGDRVANDVVLKDTIPAGTSFVNASDGGTAAGGTVTWRLGDIGPNQSKDVTLTVKAESIGETRNCAMAEAVCAAPVEDCVPTTIKGIPAVLLEVIDLYDPIEVGKEETYVITVTNQGSATDSNIAIVVTLEDAQAFVSGSGATPVVQQQGQVIKFAPLASLAPKAKAEWQLVVRAVAAANIRLAVEMTTDQLTRPVNETESTNQY
jgi:uncharacterized repeat protein (TIGR01451 family)